MAKRDSRTPQMWRTRWKTSGWKRTRRGAAIVGYSGPPSRMPSSAVVAAKDSDGSARTRSPPTETSNGFATLRYEAN